MARRSAKNDHSATTKTELAARFEKMAAAYVTVASAVAGAALMSASTAEAKIVYTQKTVSISTSYALDLNGDGNLDAVVANECTSEVGGCNGTVGVLLGRVDGSFQPGITYVAGKNPSSVAVGDFNGDGKLDVATVSSVVL